ncbi:hypothetical protein [Nocardioides lijunqiniae]|nr:hypothetical protein [Nocardioides lijunqiniae]
MRTETEHELDTLMPHVSEILSAVVSVGLTAVALVVLAVVLSRLMRH